MGLIVSYILIGLLFITILFLLLFLLRMKEKILYLEKRYSKLLQGEKVSSMETIILKRFAEIDMLKKSTRTVADTLGAISNMCEASLQKVGLVKYDAFDDVGGNLSHALAMLDRNNNGVIINVIHSKDRCFTYAKEVIKGKVYTVLSEEEQDALNKALDAENTGIILKPEENE